MCRDRRSHAWRFRARQPGKKDPHPSVVLTRPVFRSSTTAHPHVVATFTVAILHLSLRFDSDGGQRRYTQHREEGVSSHSPVNGNSWAALLTTEWRAWLFSLLLISMLYFCTFKTQNRSSQYHRRPAPRGLVMRQTRVYFSASHSSNSVAQCAIAPSTPPRHSIHHCPSHYNAH